MRQYSCIADQDRDFGKGVVKAAHSLLPPITAIRPSWPASRSADSEDEQQDDSRHYDKASVYKKIEQREQDSESYAHNQHTFVEFVQHWWHYLAHLAQQFAARGRHLGRIRHISAAVGKLSYAEEKSVIGSQVSTSLAYNEVGDAWSRDYGFYVGLCTLVTCMMSHLWPRRPSSASGLALQRRISILPGCHCRAQSRQPLTERLLLFHTPSPEVCFRKPWRASVEA